MPSGGMMGASVLSSSPGAYTDTAVLLQPWSSLRNADHTSIAHSFSMRPPCLCSCTCWLLHGSHEVVGDNFALFRVICCRHVGSSLAYLCSLQTKGLTVSHFICIVLLGKSSIPSERWLSQVQMPACVPNSSCCTLWWRESGTKTPIPGPVSCRHGCTLLRKPPSPWVTGSVSRRLQ